MLAVPATILSAEPEIAQVAGGHDQSTDKSKNRFLGARDGKSSDQEKTESQNPEHDHAEILMPSTAEGYRDYARRNDQKKQKFVKNLLEQERRTHDRKQYERNRHQKTVDNA